MNKLKLIIFSGFGFLSLLLILLLWHANSFALTKTAVYKNNNSIIVYNGQNYYQCQTTSTANSCSFNFSTSSTDSAGSPVFTPQSVTVASQGILSGTLNPSTYYFNQSMIAGFCGITQIPFKQGFSPKCSFNSGDISSLSCTAFWSKFGQNASFIISGFSLNNSGLFSNINTTSAQFSPTSAILFQGQKPLTYSAGGFQFTSCLGPNQFNSKTSPNTHEGLQLSTTGYVAPKSTNSANTTGLNNNNSKADCTGSGIVMAWLICPIIKGISSAISYFYDYIIAPMLNVNSGQFIGSSSFFYKAWSNFRVIADIILVLIMLIVVFGETIGGGLLEAYTIKKVIPRLVVMVILSNISVYIVVGLIDIFNILGKGIEALLVAPFPNLNITPGTFTGVTSLAVVLTGIWAGGLVVGGFAFFLLFLLIPGILALVATFITLGLRQIIIMFLLIVSPIAFILYILPNTEKYFKKWWGLLIKTLMVYPIVFAIYALSQIAIVGLFNINTTSGVLNVLDSFLAIFAILLPIFLIPFAFKMSGGMVGATYGLLNKTMKGESYKRFMAGQKKKAFGKQVGKMQSGNRFSTDTGDSALNAINRKRNSWLQNATLLPEAMQGRKSGSSFSNNLKAAKGLRNNQIGMEALKNQSAALQSIAGDPDAVDAGSAHGTNEDLITAFLADAMVKKKKGSALTDNELRDIKLKARNVAQAVRSMGHGVFKEIAPTLKSQTSPAYSSGVSGLLSEVIAASGGNIELAKQGSMRATKAAGEAGRSDIALSAGDTLTALDEVQKVYDTYGTFSSPGAVASLSEINDKYHERIIQTKGASALVGAKSSAIDNLAPTMLSGLSSYSPVGQNTDDFYKRLATIANTYDTLSSISPENAAKFSDQVLSSKDFGDGSDSVINVLERNRTNPTFLKFRREGMMQPPLGGQGTGS